MNFGALVASVRDDLRIGNSRDVDIKRKVIEAIAAERSSTYGWMHDTFELTTKDGVARYGRQHGFPSGVQGISGDALVLIDGSETNTSTASRRSFDYVRNLRSVAGSTSSTWPAVYALASPEELVVYPTPSAGHVFRFEATINPLPPRAVPDGSGGWEFPDGDDFTNAWFDPDRGFYIIAAITRYLVAKDVLADDESASRALSSVAGHRTTERRLHSSQMMPRRADPWPRF